MKYFITIFIIFLISFSSCHRPTHTSTVTYFGYNETPVDNSPISVKYDTVKSVYMLITDKDTLVKCKIVYGQETIYISNSSKWILTTYYDMIEHKTKTQFSYVGNYGSTTTVICTAITTNNLVCSSGDYTTIMIDNRPVKIHILKCRNNKCYYTFMNDTIVYVTNSKDVSQLNTPYKEDSLEYQPFDIVRCIKDCE